MDMDITMDIYKHRAMANNHDLYLYLLSIRDFRTVKLGLGIPIVVFLFFFACGGLVGPRVTVTRRSWTALSCIILTSMSVAQRPWRVGRETRRVDETRRDETRRGGPHERAIARAEA